MLGRVSPGQQLSLFLLPLDLEPSWNSTRGWEGGGQGERGCQSVSGGAWGRPHLHGRNSRPSFFFRSWSPALHQCLHT